MKVLAIGAHPDDVEILCGGMLARFAQEGAEVWMCSVANGDHGSFEYSASDLARVRVAEAEKAASLIGAQHRVLGISDCEVNASSARQRSLIVDLIREARPDLILTHHPEDYMADHIETSRLVFDRSFAAILPLYETTRGRHDLISPIYYMETVAGFEVLPTEFVDISERLEG